MMVTDTHTMDINEVRRFLPHRYPFLLVDRVLSVEPGKSIIALKNITINEPFFNGHFPSKPVMPGVLMIEALAQAGGILLYKTANIYPSYDEIFYLAGLNDVRYKRIVVPGDQLTLTVNLLKTKLDLWKFEGVAQVGDEIACAAELMIKKASSE